MKRGKRMQRLVVDYPLSSLLMTFFYCARVNLKLTPKLVDAVLNDPTNG